MKITDIIVILLFILPGILAEKIVYLFGMPTDKKPSEFRDIVRGILFSTPIVFFTLWISYLINRFSEYPKFIQAFNSTYYVITFVCLIFLVTIAFGLVIGILKEYLYEAVDFIRKRLLKRVGLDDKSCWRSFFEKNEPRYLIVKHGDKTYTLNSHQLMTILVVPLQV